MKAIEKIWKVVQIIDEQRKITVGGDTCMIAPDDLTPLTLTEVESILHKLEVDEEAIVLIAKPHSSRSNRDRSQHFHVGIMDRFDAVKDRVYAERSFGVDQLTGMALLRVWDVIQDLAEKKQLTTKPEIVFPLVPTVIRRAELLPGEAANAVNEYCSGRVQALDFLQEIGVVQSYSYTEEGTPYQDMSAVIDRVKFDGAFEVVIERWQAVCEEKNEAAKAGNQDLCVKYTNGFLHIGEHQIEIGDDTKEDQLCEVLFSDVESVQKEWGNDEVLKKWGWDESRYLDPEGKAIPDELKTVYRAAKRINKKVRNITKHRVEKILSEHTKSVSVLPKYRNICDE